MRKFKKKKGIKAQRAKPPNPTGAIDALTGNEEQKKTEEKKTKKKKEINLGAQPSYPGPFR